MASSAGHPQLICHCCVAPFANRASMTSYVCHCSLNKPAKHIRLPQLNKADNDLLQMLSLHRQRDKLIASEQPVRPNLDLQIPLSARSISFSTQSSFDDSVCAYFAPDEAHPEQEGLPSTLNTKSSSSCHLYKYSRREQNNFYASIKRARLKKQYSTVKRPPTSAPVFNHRNCSIHLPTQITSRQRLNTNSSNSYPLIFDPHFSSLVRLSTHSRLENYFSTIRICFHLIHSIASQEFQIIVNSNDQQRHVSYTAFSFINILRQTMTDYSIELQKSSKRNYFQSFQLQDPSTKVPRNDQSMTPQSQREDRQQQQPHLETQASRIVPATTNTHSVRNEPVSVDLTSEDRQQPIDRTNTEPLIDSFLPIVEEPRSNRNPSPIFLKRQKIEPEQAKDLFPVSSRARIRVINASADTSTPPQSRGKPSNSLSKLDENSPSKPPRMSTRKSSIKTELIAETPPPSQSIPVISSSSEIAKQWLTHNVFYRCHACSHEEFFVVLSRECMNLHISSKHGNMEENFKQRLTKFLNKRGRSLTIFQHYLKWQQPWSEKEVEQMFILSNK